MNKIYFEINNIEFELTKINIQKHYDDEIYKSWNGKAVSQITNCFDKLIGYKHKTEIGEIIINSIFIKNGQTFIDFIGVGSLNYKNISNLEGLKNV